MKYMTILLCFAFVSCANAPETTIKKEQANLEKSDTTPEDFITAWNNALFARDWEKVAQFYANKVDIYGVRKSKAEILTSKKKYFEENKNFQQQISDIGANQIFYNTEEIYLTKTYSDARGNKKEADCFLIFSKMLRELGKSLEKQTERL